jgi:hypothetical protein
LEYVADLRDSAAHFVSILNTDIVYQKPPKKNNEDYEKIIQSNERLQGRVLFERQRKFAHVKLHKNS